MSLVDLQNALQSQADAHAGVVTISAAVITSASLTPRDNFDGLIQSYLKLSGGLSVTVADKIPAPSGNTLAFSGKLSFLGLSNVTASLTITLSDAQNTVDLSFNVSLGDGWNFSNNFTAVKGYPFNDLTLNSAYYVFTTNPADSFNWNNQSIPLQQGLNFVSSLVMGGLFGILEGVLESFSKTDTVAFYGAIDTTALTDVTAQMPKMSMVGSIGSAVKALPKYFPLTNPRIGIEVDKDADGNPTIWVGFITTLEVESTPLGDLKAGILQGSSSLTLMLVPETTITIETIIDLMAGEDFRNSIPPDLKDAFSAFGLTSLTLGLNLKSFGISLISASIGATKSWEMGQFTVDSLVLRYTIMDPFGNKDTSFFFEATAKIFQNVFDGEFVFEITYDLSSSAMTIIANFEGVVPLSKVISELAGLTIPSDIDVELDDFGMSFTKSTPSVYEYTLYGSAKASFPLPLVGGQLQSNFSAFIDSASKTYQVIGTFIIGSSGFQAQMDLGKNTDLLSATWTALGTNYLGVSSVMTELGLPAPDIPDGVDLNLSFIGLSYDFSNKIMTLEGDSVNYGKAVFVARQVTTQPGQGGQGGGNNGQGSGTSSWQTFFGIGVKQPINLSNLPLIDKVLSADETVQIQNIQFVIATAPLDQNAATIINQDINELGTGYPNVPASGLQPGVGLSMMFAAGSDKIPLGISTSSTSAQGGGTTPPSVTDGSTTGLPATQSNTGTPTTPSTASSDGTVWFNLQKTFGPVTFQKVGVRYKDSVLYFLMNASLSAGGLTITFIGLGLGSPLTTFSLKVNLDGLAITFQEGPIEISGGMIGTIDPLNFYGEIMLGFPELTISALGGYAEVEGHPSFFLYAVLDYPIGGPSFFFITGVAAGFGFNRKLVVPDVSGVATFPLVAWAVGAPGTPGMNPGGDIGAQVTQVLTKLSTSGVVAPSVGDYWLALGIRFTSFELVQSFALLTIIFGTRFEIDLLGLSTLSLPPDVSPPVAQAQLELKASFAPDTGLLAIAGQLTPQSYVLSQACHLTGGFAFYVWFSGDYEGQFVITLGGYSPQFTVPDYYPKVPRLGLNWQVSSELTVKGDLYFALTSNAVMAGGGMSAVWKSGGISAWFDVEADFLMVFTPFHYYLSASIHLGASFRINLLFTHVTITIHLGVGLEIWGPEFTGEATIDLSIISFTIHFGASGQGTQTTISWPDFVKQLMPTAQSSANQQVRGSKTRAASADDDQPPAIVQITVSNGLIKTLSTKAGELNYVVNGEKFEMITQSAIPSKDYSFSSNLTLASQLDSQCQQGNAQTITPNTDFGVGPTGTSSEDFTSTHSITITTNEESQFIAVPVLRNVPKALWEVKSFDSHGVPQNTDPVNDTTISNVMIGFRLVPCVKPPDQTLPIDLSNLQYTIDLNIEHFVWSNPTYPTTDSFSTETVSSTIDGTLAQGNRPQLLAAMVQVFPSISTDVNVSDLANQSTNYLLANPVLSLLGEQKSST